MHRCGHTASRRVIEKLAAIHQYPPLLAEYRLQGCGAKADRNLRMNGCKFGLQPGTTGRDFRVRGLLVNAPFAPLFELEVLHRVRDVHLGTVNLGRLKRTIEYAAGRPYERLAGEIFLVTGLFAHHDDASLRGTRTEDRLRGVPVQLTSPAFLDRSAQLGQCRTVGHVRLSARKSTGSHIDS